MKPISRFAATAAVSGGLALPGLGMAGPAAADYYWFDWCPGQTPPSAASNRSLDWDLERLPPVPLPGQRSHRRERSPVSRAATGARRDLRYGSVHRNTHPLRALTTERLACEMGRAVINR